MAHESQRMEGPASGTPVAAPPVDSADTSASMPGVSGRERRKPWCTRYVLYGLLVVLLGIATPYGWQLWQYYRTHESTDDAYVVGDIVPVSPQVNGTVLAVHVVDNQPVEAAQLLAQLDPRDFEVRVKQVEAAVAVAAANLRRAEIEVHLTQESTSTDTERTSATLRGAQIATQEAQQSTAEAAARLRTTEAAVAAAAAEVDMWHARMDMAQAEFARMQALRTDGVVSQQQFDTSDSALKSARAPIEASNKHKAKVPICDMSAFSILGSGVSESASAIVVTSKIVQVAELMICPAGNCRLMSWASRERHTLAKTTEAARTNRFFCVRKILFAPAYAVSPRYESGRPARFSRWESTSSRRFKENRLRRVSLFQCV